MKANTIARPKVGIVRIGLCEVADKFKIDLKMVVIVEKFILSDVCTGKLLIRQLNSSFRPQRSGEPESRKGLAITGFPPSRE